MQSKFACEASSPTSHPQQPTVPANMIQQFGSTTWSALKRCTFQDGRLHLSRYICSVCWPGSALFLVLEAFESRQRNRSSNLKVFRIDEASCSAEQQQASCTRAMSAAFILALLLLLGLFRISSSREGGMGRAWADAYIDNDP
eukprot:TRINITY_DN23065_c0_g1_i1.p2 TRINITY_DN23065_c0_g1~~TRINITY_DN23065_c0_g1_i1.p2  ORF type:complete len:143 (-),score=19.99 TRINITY_DN23065_c0_g1_i1:173-601(-)